MKMMQVNFGPKFDWFDTLEKLEDGAQVSEEDQSKLRDMAGDWPTCACGQLCTLLPRGNSKEPRDETLMSLGCRFASYVEARNWFAAIRCMKQIERRSTKLLREMGIPVVFTERHRFKLVPEEKPALPVKTFAAHMAQPGTVACCRHAA